MANKVYTQLSRFDSDAIVELFEIDLSIVGEGIFRFYSGTNQNSEPIVWQGNTYNPLPIEATDFAINGTGAPARPKLKLANANGVMSMLVTNFSDLVGAKVTRKRTLAKYLDKENFKGWKGYALDCRDTQITYSPDIGKQMLGDLTVMYRFKPRSIALGRQNVIDKAYWGEFALTHEPASHVSFYHSIGDPKIEGYFGADYPAQYGKAIENQWNSLVYRRRFAGSPLLNVSLNALAPYSHNPAVFVAGSSPGLTNQRLSIGTGYTTVGFDGLIDDICIMNRYVSDAEVLAYLAHEDIDMTGAIFSISFEKSVISDQGHAPLGTYNVKYAPVYDTNPDSDPNEFFPDEVYFITQKTQENLFSVDFELGSVFDLQGVKIPRRQVIANLCQWQYRGDGCGYQGTAYHTEFDTPCTKELDNCGKRLTSCKLRHGPRSRLPFGGFIGATLAQ